MNIQKNNKRVLTISSMFALASVIIGAGTINPANADTTIDNNAIAHTAIDFSLPHKEINKSYAINNADKCVNENGYYGKNTANQHAYDYYIAVKEVLASENDMSSTYYAGSDRFVSAVMYHTVDKNFPKLGIINQREYMELSEDWEYVSNSLEDAQPGDVLVTFSNNTSVGKNHIAIYTGYIAGKHMVADATNGACKEGVGGARIGVHYEWRGNENVIVDTNNRLYRVFRFIG